MTKKAKILLIEDDPILSSMYETEFEIYGFDVVVASSGKEGIKVSKKVKADLVFLDLLLGDMDGLDVLREMKKDPKSRDLKVIVLTNLTKKGLEEDCLNAGALAYFVKSSLIPKEVVKKAKEFINR